MILPSISGSTIVVSYDLFAQRLRSFGLLYMVTTL